MFRMMSPVQLSLVTHRQLIVPITGGKHKAVQSTSVQRHKGLAKSLKESHFLQGTGLNADMCSLLLMRN